MGFDTDLLKLLSALVVAIFLAVPYIKKEYVPVLMSLKKRTEIIRVNKAVLTERKVASSNELDKGGAK